MSTHVPDPHIARGAPLAMPGGVAYSGSPQPVGSLVAVTPPAQYQAGMSANPTHKRKALGLIPAQPGSLHPMIVREAPRVKIDPADVSRTRAELRRAKFAAETAQNMLIATAGPDLRNTGSEDYAKKLLASRDASDLVAALIRKLAEMEAASASRPIRVVLSVVREPAEVRDVIGADTAYVCLHDGCKGERWADEAAMRRAHPTDAEMRQKQHCHVYALLCDAPLDPLDPEGERVGYVAPVGSDGTTVQHATARDVDPGASADEVADLRAQLAEMKAMLAEVMAGKRAKG